MAAASTGNAWPVLSVLPAIGHHCSEATVNRKLSTVSIFYQHAARHGLDLGDLITCWDPGARQGGYGQGRLTRSQLKLP